MPFSAESLRRTSHGEVRIKPIYSIMRHQSGWWRMMLLLMLLAALSACSEAAPKSASPSENIVATSTPAAAFWRSAAEPYSGTLLRGISENSPPSLYVRDVLAPAFTGDTGIGVELEISSIDVIEEIINAGGRDYDFVYVEQDVIYGYLAQNRLVNLTGLLREHPALNAPAFNLIDFTDFSKAFMEPESGDLYGVPIEAFIKVYVYRTDLFNDPAIQAAFASEHHYPLAPAVTFQQYRDIAEFFTRYGREQGLDLWGTTVQGTATDIPSVYEFFETIAPSFGVYNWGIDPTTYRATAAHGGTLDSEQAIAALQFWVDMLQYAPPDATRSDWNMVADAFAAGRAAQGWIYGENVAWIAADPERSQVAGKVGVALPPTAPGVMEDATIGAGYLGYYDGAAFGIPVDSQHKEATLLWLQYLGQAGVQPDWASASGRVVHFSTFNNGLVKAQDRRLNGYYTLMKKHGTLFAGAPPFPFLAEVRDRVAPYIYAALLHELTPAQALQQAAVAVDEELAQLGYGPRAE